MSLPFLGAGAQDSRPCLVSSLLVSPPPCLPTTHPLSPPPSLQFAVGKASPSASGSSSSTEREEKGREIDHQMMEVMSSLESEVHRLTEELHKSSQAAHSEIQEHKKAHDDVKARHDQMQEDYFAKVSAICLRLHLPPSIYRTTSQLPPPPVPLPRSRRWRRTGSSWKRCISLSRLASANTCRRCERRKRNFTSRR